MNLNNFIPNVMQLVSVIGTYSKADLLNNKAHAYRRYVGYILLLLGYLLTSIPLFNVYLELSEKVVERYPITVLFLF